MTLILQYVSGGRGGEGYLVKLITKGRHVRFRTQSLLSAAGTNGHIDIGRTSLNAHLTISVPLYGTPGGAAPLKMQHEEHYTKNCERHFSYLNLFRVSQTWDRAVTKDLL